MTYSTDPEFLPCFITCDCGSEYALEPTAFESTADKECDCPRDEQREATALDGHFKVNESSFSSQYRAGSGGLL